MWKIKGQLECNGSEISQFASLCLGAWARTVCIEAETEENKT